MKESSARFSLTKKSLITGQPSYLRFLLLLDSHRSIWSSSLITFSRPSFASLPIDGTSNSQMHFAVLIYSTCFVFFKYVHSCISIEHVMLL